MRSVPAADWPSTFTCLREEGYAFFDFLTAIDRVDRIEVVARVVDPQTREAVMCSTMVSDDTLGSLTGSHPGATWHERETSEMFGIAFDGLADTRPLLLRGPVDAPPLRHSTVLVARVARPWPGEPSEGANRRRTRPPGVPDDFIVEGQ